MSFIQKLSVGVLIVFVGYGKVSYGAILANVGEKVIQEDQLRGEYDAISSEQKKAINTDEGSRRNLLDSLVNAEVLMLAAKKANMDKEEDFKLALERFSRQYLATKFIQKALEPKIEKTDLKKFYEENKRFFDTSQICAHHIVVAEVDEATEITQTAKRKGANFEALAVKHSLDPGVKENKGNLGCFTKERMVPEFSAAAFNMRKGEVKGPVRTMYGYHVIRVDEIKLGKVPGYEEIEQRVKETLRLKLASEVISDLREKSNVKINEENLKKFRL